MSAAKETIYVFDEREPVWKSTVRDAVSFGFLTGTALALNTQMPPSGWLNATIGIVWVLWLVGKGLKRRMEKTPADAIAWIHEQYPETRGGQ